MDGCKKNTAVLGLVTLLLLSACVGYINNYDLNEILLSEEDPVLDYGLKITFERDRLDVGEDSLISIETVNYNENKSIFFNIEVVASEGLELRDLNESHLGNETTYNITVGPDSMDQRFLLFDAHKEGDHFVSASSMVEIPPRAQARISGAAKVVVESKKPVTEKTTTEENPTGEEEQVSQRLITVLVVIFTIVMIAIFRYSSNESRFDVIKGLVAAITIGVFMTETALGLFGFLQSAYTPIVHILSISIVSIIIYYYIFTRI